MTHFFLSVNGTRIDANFMVSIANFVLQVVTQHKSGYNPGSKCVLTETPKGGGHPCITSAKGLGWVGLEKFAIFGDVWYCIYADIVSGWVGLKKSKNVRNIGMILK